MATPERIQTITRDCSRDDCRIDSLGGTRTLMGWSPSYGKDGNPIGKDPNTTRMAYRCRTCRKGWVVTSRGSYPDWVEERPDGF